MHGGPASWEEPACWAGLCGAGWERGSCAGVGGMLAGPLATPALLQAEQRSSVSEAQFTAASGTACQEQGCSVRFDLTFCSSSFNNVSQLFF